MRATLPLLMVLGVVAGCAQSQPPPAAFSEKVAETAAFKASSGVDGVYRPVTGRASGSGQCLRSTFNGVIRVSNGVASMQTASAGQLQERIGPDGSLLIENGRQTLRGQFVGSSFNGTYSTGRCSYTLDLRKATEGL